MIPHYDGEVIFSCRDEEGPIDVVDESTARTLHFGTSARQSTMFRGDPVALALAYTRCMMAGLLFVEEVRAALILGLGGGSLAKFLLHHFADCKVDAVEKRSRVVEVARGFFGLPDDPRLRVFEGPAEGFLPQLEAGAYDLVLVDIHDCDGMARAQAEAGFFAACQRLMGERGLLVVNLWSGERRAVLRRVTDQLDDCFAGQVMQLPVARKSNTVALGFNYLVPQRLLGGEGMRARAQELGERMGIDFGGVLGDLVRGNRRWV